MSLPNRSLPLPGVLGGHLSVLRMPYLMECRHLPGGLGSHQQVYADNTIQGGCLGPCDITLTSRASGDQRSATQVVNQVCVTKPSKSPGHRGSGSIPVGQCSVCIVPHQCQKGLALIPCVHKEGTAGGFMPGTSLGSVSCVSSLCWFSSVSFAVINCNHEYNSFQ